MPSNTLSWQNRFPASQLKIYRSSAAFEVTSLPSVLAIIDGDASSFVDETPAFSTRYWYAVGAVLSGSPVVERVSAPVAIRTVDAPVSGGFSKFVPSGSDRYVLFDGDVFNVIEAVGPLILASGGETLVSSDGFTLRAS